MTKTKHARLVEQHRKFNRSLKQQHRHSEQLSFDQYVDYVHGKLNQRKPEHKKSRGEFVELTWHMPSTYRSNSDIPSRSITTGVAARPERKEYTGTYVTGIATMHKSNAVPVTNPEQAKDIARMRRN